MIYFTKLQKIYFLTAIIVAYAFAIFIQYNFILNCDSSWLILAARRLLRGGSYTRDFFETNPPMIIYLSIIPIAFEKLFSINIMLSAKICIFLLATFSLLICFYLVKRIFNAKDILLAILYMLGLVIAYLVLPFWSFGERDHLLLMFAMPYLLAVVCQLKKDNLNIYIKLIVGLLAGIGFSLKPFFLLTPILVELYFVFATKRLLSWVRVEVITMLLLMMIYSVIVLIFQPDYLFVVIPYALRNYYSGPSTPLIYGIVNLGLMFCILPILFYFIQYPNNPYRPLCTVLLITLIGFIFSFVAQRNFAFYQFFPAWAVGILLTGFLFALFLRQSNINKYNYLLLSLLAIVAFIFLWYCDHLIWLRIVFYPVQFFAFFSIMLAILFYQINKNILKVILSLCFIIGLSAYFSYLMALDRWYSYHFAATLLMIFLLCFIAVPKINNSKKHSLFAVTLGILLFAFPFDYSLSVFEFSRTLDPRISPIISFFEKQKQQHPSFYFFSTSMVFFFPTIDMIDIELVSRFPSFWMVSGLLEKETKNNIYHQEVIKDKSFLVKMVVDDLIRSKPRFVFVDTSRYKNHLGMHDLNYLNYFSANNTFQKVWKNYRYLTKLEIDSGTFPNIHYQFQVYKRIG